MTADPLSFALEALVAGLILVGVFFGLVGSWGLIKLPDAMTRLHAPTKATTLGVGALLIASVAQSALEGAFTFHELIISLFLFITAPVVSNMVAKVWLHLEGRPDALPRTGRKSGWATLDHRPDPKR